MNLQRQTRLRGQTIYLSAGIPRSRDRQFDENSLPTPLAVDEAVVSLARAVFGADGQIAMADDPQLTSLVCQVAGEYRVPSTAEQSTNRGMNAQSTPVCVIESRSTRSRVTEMRRLFEQLELATFREWERLPNEQAGQSPLRRVLQEYQLTGMVCIGDPPFLLADLQAYQELNCQFPIYAIQSCGGQASTIAQLSPLSGLIRYVDTELLEKLRPVRRQLHGLEPGSDAPGQQIDIPESDRFQYVPYILIMQHIIDLLGS